MDKTQQLMVFAIDDKLRTITMRSLCCQKKKCVGVKLC